jgi:uncharacterized protein (DUF362 family)
MSRTLGIGEQFRNPFMDDGVALVSRVNASGRPVKEGILKSVNLIGGFSKAIQKGDRVLLKPNYNSSDPPASSEPEFLKTLVELLFENGAAEVVVGESSMEGTSTRRVMKRTGTLEALKDSGAEVVFFDEGRWVEIDVGGQYLKRVGLAERALHVDKVVHSCCMKTHFRADFSLSLKLAFGFTKGSERIGFHMMHLKEKLIDLNLVVHPNLIVMDGRRCFITGGPFSGEVREPKLILASGDRVAVDVEAIKTIQNFDGSKLKDDPWRYTQIKHATELRLGVKNRCEYKVVE